MIQFNTLISVPTLDYISIIFVLVVLVGVIYRFRLWLRNVPQGFFHYARTSLGYGKLASLFSSELVNRVVAERNVITDSKARWLSHFLVFWGFIGLAIATVWDDVFYHQGNLPSPFSLQNPGNIIGNIACLMAIVGTTMMLGRYLFVPKFKENRRGDTIFFIILYIALLTGFATEFTRYSGSSMPANASYLIHLAIVGALFISAPFTHFFHALLTPFARYVERIRFALLAKRGDAYLGDRFLEMTKSSESVKAGSVAATRPAWLSSKQDKKEKEKK